MIHIEAWLESYLRAMKGAFGDRLWFVGLQGSYGRGEETENSDIDVVAVLDELTAEDVEAYRALLDTLDHRELICGFLSGREELVHWEPSDLFQFCHDTTPLLGSLDAVLARVDADAVARAIRIGACNIYHGCVHNLLFGQKGKTLRELFKAATFVVRAMVYRRTVHFCRRLEELKDQADPEDAAIVKAYSAINRGGIADFKGQSQLLFQWAQKTIHQLPRQ